MNEQRRQWLVLPAPAEHACADTTRTPARSPGSSVVRLTRATVTRFADNKVLTLAAYAGFVFTKVLATSGWRISTALAVLNASSLPGVVAGATLSALPPLSLVLLSVATFWLTSGRWSGKWRDPLRKREGRRADAGHVLERNRVFFVGVGSVAVVVLAVESWSLTAIVLGVAIVFGLLDRGTMLRRTSLTLFAGLIAVLTYAQVVSSVWLPHEAIVFGSPRHVVVGYVVSTDDNQITVLESRSRLLVEVPMAAVHTRNQCLVSETGFGGLLPVSHYSVLLLIVHEPSPRTCPAPTGTRTD